MKKLDPQFCLFLGLFVAIVAGCAEGPIEPDPKVVAELRERVLLEAEPHGAVTPLDWRSAQPAADAGADRVVLVGQVGGMPNPWPEMHPQFPWVSGEATFFLVDPSTAAEFLEHAGADGIEQAEAHAADCPFCAREAANKTTSIAAVSLLDKAGKPVPIDAGELLGLKVGDHVVVQGKASLLAGDLLVVEADGLFVRN